MPTAKAFLLPTVYLPYSQLTQWDNEPDNPGHVGELTPKGFTGHGDIQTVSNFFTDRFKPPYYKGQLDPGLDGQEYHGTPASFLGEFENGTDVFGGIVLDPLALSDAELDALPLCLTLRWRTWVEDCECQADDLGASDLVPVVFTDCECEADSIDVGTVGLDLVEDCECEADLIEVS